MYDIIIVGGGPSGSSAARISASKELKVLLLEKEEFPRYKACGGALSEQAISYLDFEIPNSIYERNVYGARVHYKYKSIAQKKTYRIATIVSRDVFDNFLLEKASEVGVTIKIKEKVKDIIEHSDYIKVITDRQIYLSRFVVVAEGSSGKLKNKIRKKDKKKEFGVCAVTEIEKENNIIDKYIFELIDIHFGVSNSGYGWIFPHENYFSIGVGGIALYMDNPKKILKDFLINNGFYTKNKYKIHTHLIPAGGIKRRTTSNRIVLVGDAGGFVDSFYGEGIAYAIKSGQIAASVIYDVLRTDFSVKLSDYENLCEREFNNNLKYSLFFSKLMHKFPYVFYNLFTSNKSVLNKYLEVPAAKITYKQFMKWLIPKIPSYVFLNFFKSN